MARWSLVGRGRIRCGRIGRVEKGSVRCLHVAIGNVWLGVIRCSAAGFGWAGESECGWAESGQARGGRHGIFRCERLGAGCQVGFGMLRSAGEAGLRASGRMWSGL